MNILIFGPNGSGKGTQGAVVQGEFSITHIETGGIFRENIKGGTDLGKKAKQFIDRGDLVPDDITIPMILDRLKKDDCSKGWLLDGFPRNPAQAVALKEALDAENIDLDYVIEIKLDREIAKKRIMGRRICATDPNHPNNVYIDAIKPDNELECRVCGSKMSVRGDDQDERAIDKRHGIYYDESEGTMAAVIYFKDLAQKDADAKPLFLELDGTPGVKEVSTTLLSQLV